MVSILLFFFSSRRRHTRSKRDWSSDVCSSDLLLRAVGGIPGVRRLRFTSPYPTDFTDGVVAAMAETPAVCEHVHLPVQSGSSRVLKRMLRRYDRDRYLEVVAALRGAVPGMALTTDI